MVIGVDMVETVGFCDGLDVSGWKENLKVVLGF